MKIDKKCDGVLRFSFSLPLRKNVHLRGFRISTTVGRVYSKILKRACVDTFFIVFVKLKFGSNLYDCRNTFTPFYTHMHRAFSALFMYEGEV